MTWISTIEYDQASGRLRQLYDRVKGPDGIVDNIMMSHSLRPHTMEGHMALYKHVLHHTANQVPKWFLEAIGVWVSLLNRCDYCVDHHFEGMRRLVGDQARSAAIREALDSGKIESGPFAAKESAALRYAETLTRGPSAVSEAVIEGLRGLGYDDGEILEVNQVVAYFAYANRTVLGLGCNTAGDTLGPAPGNAEDPDDWSHL
jgi:uncharacterized peroxidase-related enzyme